jgi:putative hydrolase of the HAD superfamily
MVIRGVVFDIDDTLYLEKDYVRSGFEHVARSVGSSSTEIDFLSIWLSDAFVTGVRGDTFDRLRDAFPAVAARYTTAELVGIYRMHPPIVEFVPGAAEVLDRLLEGGVRLGILSDGPFESQSAKASALGLDRWCDPIVLTSALGPGFAKPETAGFEAIAAGWGLAAADLVYLADNPEKDFAGPRRLGWLTVRIRHDGQLRHALEAPSDSFRPDVEIGSLRDLLPLVNIDS